MSRSFGHVDRIDEYCMAKRVLIAEVDERRRVHAG